MLPRELRRPNGPLVAFLDEHIAGIRTEAQQIPLIPENLHLFIQAGNNVAALEILKSHLSE